MKGGLAFLEQIRNLVIPADPVLEGSVIDRTKSGGGGWIAQQFIRSINAILSGYHRQHNTDDTHKTITATGSISERGRTIPMGVWIPAPYTASDFSAPSGTTWQVTGPQVTAMAYMLTGTTMWLSWTITASTVAFAATSSLLIRIPANGRAVRAQIGTFSYNDNGTKGTGSCQVNPNVVGGLSVTLKKDLAGTNWTVSTNLSVAGTMAFEVSGV